MLELARIHQALIAGLIRTTDLYREVLVALTNAGATDAPAELRHRLNWATDAEMSKAAEHLAIIKGLCGVPNQPTGGPGKG
jgi:hypothetical protein